MVSKYRTPEYAQVNSGWILLDAADQLFRLSKGRVYNNKKEFDPEQCPKWKCLYGLLTNEIPNEVKKKQNGDLKNTKILTLCQDNKTSSQLNQLLTMGAGKYLLYTALRRDHPVNKIADKYKNIKNTLPEEVKSKHKAKNKKMESDDKAGEDLGDDVCNDFFGDEDNRSNYVLTLSQCPTQTESEDGIEENSIFEPFSQMEKLDITQAIVEKPIIYIQTFKENGNNFSLEQTLEHLKPDYIIMYHSDVSAIRQIEVYEARKKPEESILTVYFIVHNKTVEEQAYLTALKREKLAFELLIQTKSVMVVPTYQDGKTEEYFNLNVEEESDTAGSRKAGGQAAQTERPFVIVDMREFRSELPALLHKRGIHIEPVTISIGDYILTPEICVERKSISDLIGSLNSGRLFTQCTHMCRNYPRAVLLVEFDQNRPFNLQGHLVVSHDLSVTEVRQRLQLLTIHFPRLKIVWSPSPYATADLFHELKQRRKNPNVEQALALSGDNSEELGCERYNTLVHDFVLRLPGVTTKNVARVMNKGRSLDHLVTLTKDQMYEIIENRNDAEALYSILHVKAKPTDVGDKEDKFGAKRKYTSKIFANKKDKK